MASSQPKVRVALVGGGIGGLCLAAGLIKQPHLDVHIYESVPEYKDVGAGLALHMNAIKAMDLIGPEVKKAYFDKAHTMASDAEEEMSTQGKMEISKVAQFLVVAPKLLLARPVFKYYPASTGARRYRM